VLQEIKQGIFYWCYLHKSFGTLSFTLVSSVLIFEKAEGGIENLSALPLGAKGDVPESSESKGDSSENGVDP
jgi:hypothetical protein